MRSILVGGVTGVAAGIVATLFATNLTRPPSVETRWFKLIVQPKPQFGISYSTEALFSDIPPPDITSFSGTYKFIDPIVSENESTKFGYVIDTAMAQVDLKNVPAQYLESKDEQINGHPTKSAPITSAYYHIVFTFLLKDVDGFVLTSLHSTEETLVSGQNNHFQNTIEMPVPFRIAVRTKAVDVNPSIEKCLTCRG